MPDRLLLSERRYSRRSGCTSFTLARGTGFTKKSITTWEAKAFFRQLAEDGQPESDLRYTFALECSSRMMRRLQNRGIRKHILSQTVLFSVLSS
jgi:hypothetical protein